MSVKAARVSPKPTSVADTPGVTATSPNSRTPAPTVIPLPPKTVKRAAVPRSMGVAAKAELRREERSCGRKSELELKGGLGRMLTTMTEEGRRGRRRECMSMLWVVWERKRVKSEERNGEGPRDKLRERRSPPPF